MTPRPPIALVGIGCRLPGGANDPASLWGLVHRDRDAIRDFPPDRLDAGALYAPGGAPVPGRTRVARGGFLDDIAGFDAAFFGITAREAAVIDPQQRLLLETACDALADAGVPLDGVAGSTTGVFVGLFLRDYELVQSSPHAWDRMDAFTASGTAGCIAANRISYALDLRGPSVMVDTACSSSLTALDLACQALWLGRTDRALVGGANLLLRPEPWISLSQATMLSPDGVCRAFDARANGYVRAEGAAVVVLRRLDDALAEGDRIYAVIRGTASNQDGRTPGITVPSQRAQEQVIRAALAGAGVAPHDIGYVEAHGTGTPVGDPIEARALGAVYGPGRAEPLRIGSIKTRVGHLEAAAGVAGLIQAALALHHGAIPASLHFEQPNPAIPFDALGLRVQVAPGPWPAGGGRRVAAVNSFGFGGANAHAILESPDTAPEVRRPPDPARRDGPAILTLSARSPGALRALAGRWVEALRAPDAPHPADLAFSAARRATHHPHRLAVVGADRAAWADALAPFAAGEPAPAGIGPAAVGPSRRPVAFVFGGMGSQWPGMARELLREAPPFRAAVEACDACWRELAGGASILDELERAPEDSRIDRTEVAQPAIFAVQVGLLAMWRAAGVEPAAVVGHSVGEVAAAFAAGILDLGDALRVVLHRSRLQARVAGQGGMLAAGVSPEEAQELIADEPALSVAAINSPHAVTLSGDTAALERVAARLAAAGRFHRALRVEVPYHGPAMDPVATALAAALPDLRPRPAQMPLFSTVTGNRIEGPEMDGAYWGRNARDAVRFASAVEAVLGSGLDRFVEVGPHPVLATSLRECAAGRDVAVLASMRRGQPERATWLAAAAALHVDGQPVDWEAVVPTGGRFVALPRYPWERTRHWRESAADRALRLAEAVHPLLGREERSAEPAYSQLLQPRAFPWLADHRVQGAVVLPGAAYVEAALAVAAVRHGTGGPLAIEDVAFRKALVLGDEAPRLVTRVAAEAGGVAFWTHREDQGWVRHATARLARPVAAPEPARLDLAAIEARCATVGSADAFYARCRALGYDYGPAFQGIVTLRASDDGEVLATLALPETVPADGWRVHPALLDAAVQTVLATSEGPFADGAAYRGMYLPLAVGGVRLHAPAVGSRCRAHARVRRPSFGLVTADLTLVDDDGRVLLELVDLRMQAFDQPARDPIARAPDLLRLPTWERRPRPAAPDATDLPFPAALAAAGAPDPDRLPAARLLGPPWRQEVDQLCAGLVLRALDRLGWRDHVAPGRPFAAAALADALGVAAVHRRWFDRLLAILAEDGHLAAGGDGWRIAADPADPDPDAVWVRLFGGCPAYAAELELLRRIGDALPRVLRGEVQTLEVLAPDGAWEALEHVHRDSPGVRSANRAVQRILAELVSALPAGRRLAVLELGAGTGGLTAWAVPVLPSSSVDYCATDPAPGFVDAARHRHRDRPAFDARVLDLDRDPEDQGFGGRRFDLVLASNVLHTTADLRAALGRVRRLLAPGGLLLLVEQVDRFRPMDLLWGGLDGWRSADADLRPAPPTADADPWRALLAEAGFEEAEVVGGSRVPEVSPNAVLAARAPAARQVPRPAAPAAPAPGPWLVIGGEAIAAALERRGVDVVRAAPDADVASLLAAHPLGGVVHAGSWAQDRREAWASALALVQARARAEAGPPVWFVTRGVWRPDGGEVDPAGLPGALLWGLGRTVQNEHPTVGLRLADLGRADDAEVDGLVTEMIAPTDEDAVAFRGADRYVERIRPATAADLRRAGPPPAAFRLERSPSGGLDDLALVAIDVPVPGPGEVVIEVEAAGLDFRDVARVLGRVVGEDGEAADPALGEECAGRVVAVGPGVDRVAVGDRVVAHLRGAMATHVAATEDQVVRLPEALTLEEGASHLVVAVTCAYALEHVAAVQPGERVLVHSGAGGVGLMALQLARAAGAEVLATAGTRWKRDLLLRLGVRCVADTRDPAFADALRAQSGDGVDVVVGSLPGEALHRSLALLRPHGRYLELGTWDTAQDTPIGMGALARNASFSVIDGPSLRRHRPALAEAIAADVLGRLADRRLSPLPHRTVPVGRAAEAFRRMADGQNVGRLVLDLRDPGVACVPREVRFDGPGAWLITGGFGGFGLALARWLAARGAKTLALVGRRGPATDAAREAVAALGDQGVRVLAYAADVGDAEALAAVLDRVRAEGGPLRGVFHAAMVIDDGLVANLDLAQTERVLAPKADGALHLDRLTRNDPLEHFVLFASISGLLGPAGQASYAAANALLDALAHHRRAAGRPALSVDWGAVADAGYVARTAEARKFVTRSGLPPVPADALLAWLGELLAAGDVAQAAVGRIDVPRFRRAVARAGASPRLAPLDFDPGEAATGAAPEGEAASGGRSLQDQIARILGIPAEKFDPHRPLTELGLESLMAVELSGLLRNELGVEVPTMRLLGGARAVDLLALADAPGAAGAPPSATERPAGRAGDAGSHGVGLDPAIRPAAGPPPPPVPREVLLTGATGFVGAYLARALLDATDARIHCLVRAADPGAAAARLRANLERFGAWDAACAERLVPVVGDLARPRLGLSDARFAALAEAVDAVHHAGAFVHWAYPYGVFEAANVGGTRGLLRFAAAGRPKAVHHVSTLPVALHPGTEDPADEVGVRALQSRGLDIGYSRSKWVAEQRVTEARDRGLPVVVYRPGLVSGDSRTGTWNHRDFPCRLIRCCVALGVAPDQDVVLDLVPVDYVARAIVHLSLRADAIGRGFNLINPQPQPWREVVGRLRARGWPVALIPPEAWLERVLRAGREEEAAAALVPYFEGRPADRPLPGYPAGARGPALLERITTGRALAGSDVACPPQRLVLDRYLDWFVATGFLPTPAPAPAPSLRGALAC